MHRLERGEKVEIWGEFEGEVGGPVSCFKKVLHVMLRKG